MTYSRFEQIFFTYFEQFKKLLEAKPLILGGASGAGGGAGGPPGGFIGYLPQTRVAFDETELASSGIPPSGASLLDNLNRIRYRIDNLETGNLSIKEDGVLVGSGIAVINFLSDKVTNTGPKEVSIESDIAFLDLKDTPDSYSGHANKVISVKGTEDGLDYTVISGIADTFKVMISSSDIEDYLGNKIIASGGIRTEIIASGNYEKINIYPSGIPWTIIDNTPLRTLNFGYMGVLSVGSLNVRLFSPFNGYIDSIVASVGSPPIGSSVVIDIRKNGSSIFTLQADKPTISPGSNDDFDSNPYYRSVSKDDLFTVYIENIGSSYPGSDLTLQIRCRV